MIERVFLDVDGVLADFIGPALAHHGVIFDPKTYPPGLWDIWKFVGCTEQEFWAFDGFEFWRDLPVYPWAKPLVDGLEQLVGQQNICLLTSPSVNAMCINGKREWIAKHFPAYSKQVLFGSAKQFCAHPSTVLIDDSDGNCKKFMEAGGHVVTFPRVWNAFGERGDPARYVLDRIDEMMLVEDAA